MTTAVSSSTTSTASTLSAKTGIAGLVSGLDTDSIVASLTTSDHSRIAKEQQNVQSLQWKQTAYRGVSKALKEFQSKYLDFLSGTNMRSASLFNTVNASTTSTKIAVSTTSSAGAGNITLNDITQLATNETITGNVATSVPLTGTTAYTDNLLGVISPTQSKSFLLKLNGKVRTITLDNTFKVSASGSDANFQNALQTKIDVAFGKKSASESLINVTMTGGKLSLAASSAQLTVNALNSDTATLGYLGLKDGQTDRLSISSTLGNLPLAKKLDDVEEFKLSINSVDFTFQKTDSLTTIMSRINASTAGVTMGYSSMTDKFTLTAKESGSGENIVVNDTTGNLMTAFGLTGAEGTDKVTTAGLNAVLTINGQSVVQTSNSIEVDGVKIDLQEKSTDPITISKLTNTTTLTDTIKNFVTDYNNMISMVNGIINEDADSAYKPLTEEQKKSMTETQIKDWETKAKTGILSNDNLLKSITSKMQTLMYGSAVKGGVSLKDLGITSAGYNENGKLKLDEDKLKTALATKGSAIQELFTTEKTGLAQQLNDVISGAVKTTGAKGKRGSLIEVAGYESTISNTDNTLTTSITKLNKNITTLKTALKARETQLWNKFSALETAMQQLNVQSSMVSQFSSGA